MRGRFTQLGIVAGFVLALLLPGAAVADATTSTAPSAPTGLYALNWCNDVVLDGVVWCSVEVSWSAGPDDGGPPVTSFTVTGDVSNKPTTVGASGAAPDRYTLTWRWNPSANPDRGVDTSYTVTATNAIGTSAPATVTVNVSSVQPHRGFVFQAHNNGPKNDVLGFVFPVGSGPTDTVTVNGKKRVLTPTSGVAELTVKDKNGKKPTLYTVRYGRFHHRLVVT